jgi:hypothetical protein
MDTERLVEKFRRMGARLKVGVDGGGLRDRVRVDVGRDRKGQFFDVRVQPRVAVEAIDVRPRERHLLLAVREEDRLGLPVGAGQRFLCGHDERAWFVAAVPEGRGASNVAQAMDALKPWAVRSAEERTRVRFKDRHRRRTEAFVRQGEWFFVPLPLGAWQPVPEDRVLRDEPLSRTGGKPHRVEFLVRDGGEVVYVHSRTGRVISETQFRGLVRNSPARAGLFAAQRRNMRVLARGRVSHPDHKTIVLDGWHSVHMNTENQSRAMRFVAFID